MQTAHYINRIEMRSRSQGLTGMFVSHIYLHALKNLKRAVLLRNDERSASRFSLVLDHSAHAYRPVKLGTQSLHTASAVRSCRHLYAKLLIEELLNIITKGDACLALINVLITKPGMRRH